MARFAAPRDRATCIVEAGQVWETRAQVERLPVRGRAVVAEAAGRVVAARSSPSSGRASREASSAGRTRRPPQAVH